MGEKYHYESGAIHHDHHKELHIGTLSEKALGAMMKEFFKDDAEEVVFEEVKETKVPEAAKMAEAPKTPEEEVNRFAPQKMITDLLCGEWFDEVTTNKVKYSVSWRKQMMEALMATVYGERIAREWQERDKRLQVKSRMIGALKDAKVIRGSYNALAPQLGIDGVEQASLAKYMGEGKKQPYFDWLMDYVKQ